MKRRVTIIVPVYADWPSLRDCIAALRLNLGAHHKALFVNDCGPEAEKLESNIQNAIRGLHNFEYYRNSENLGFVKTCNRAVFELDSSDNNILLLNSDTAVTAGFLDEMLDVLYANRKHGAVSPRSNSATHASIPLRPRDGVPPSPEESYAVFKKINKLLPRFSIAVDAPGFCLLTKRELIKRYGLFDEIYSPGYAEETDFCLRLRKHGYLSLFANRAFVFHYRAETFTSDRKAKLKARNKQILLKRYPNVQRLVDEYLERVDPIDWFADVIFGPGKTTKFLIDLSAAKDDQKLDYFLGEANRYGSKKDIDIAVIGSHINLSEYSKLRLIKKNPNELFHLGYRPGLNSRGELDILNNLCLKVIEDKARGGAEQSFDVLLSKARKFPDIENLRRRWHYLPDAPTDIHHRLIPGRLKKLKRYFNNRW